MGTSTTAYTGSFGGTSSASPIIAGAALAVQGVVEAAAGLRLSPAQMRAALTDPATSTPSNDPPVDRIGVLPNLRAIIEDGSSTCARCLYPRLRGRHRRPACRRDLGQSGLILVPTTVADAQAAFGESRRDREPEQSRPRGEAGQDNFVYVRAKNRGGSDGPGTSAQVFGRRPRPL